MRDPRSHRRYTEARLAYISRHGSRAKCVLCGEPIDLTLSGSDKRGPTVEHRIPVRRLRQIASSEAELLEMACDESTWGLAHRSCQDRQGGKASRSTTRPRRHIPERDW